jgi:hypothetical protein
MGCAGATSSGACILCQAGTYQTGSGGTQFGHGVLVLSFVDYLPFLV